MKTFDEFQDEFRASLEEQAKNEYDEEYNNKIFEQLISDATIKYPPQMLESEKADIRSGMEQRLSQQGISKELYLQMRGIDEEAFEEEITPAAIDRLKRGLVLYEVAETEDIEVDADKVDAQAGRTIEYISGQLSKKDAKNFIESGSAFNLVKSITADFLMEQTVEFMRSVAMGELPEEDVEPAPEPDPASENDSTAEVEIVDEDTSTIDELENDQSETIEEVVETPEMEPEEVEPPSVDSDEVNAEAASEQE